MLKIETDRVAPVEALVRVAQMAQGVEATPLAVGIGLVVEEEAPEGAAAQSDCRGHAAVPLISNFIGLLHLWISAPRPFRSPAGIAYTRDRPWARQSVCSLADRTDLVDNPDETARPEVLGLVPDSYIWATTWPPVNAQASTPPTPAHLAPLAGIHRRRVASEQPRASTKDCAMHSTYAALFCRTAAALMTIWLGACQPAPDPERDRLQTLGHTYFHQARYRDALAAYQQAVALDSLAAEAHCHLATAYMKLGRRDSAETAYLVAIRLDSSLVLAYHNLAVAYGEAGRYQQATALLEEAVRINPGAAPSYRLLAGLHQEQGAYDRAEAALVRAVAADSTDAEALWTLGRLLRLRGRRAESEELLTCAVRFDPGNKEAHRELGMLYTYAERYDEAEGMLRRALEIDPAYPEAYYNLASLYSAQGRVEQAQILLDRFAELNRRATQVRALEKQVHQASGDLNSYLAAGRSYGALGQWEQASGMYRAVLEHQPGHVRALAGLSHAHLNQGNLNEAVALARRVIARAPGRREAREAHFTIGYVETMGGRLDQARRSFEQALQVDATFAKAHHALGNVGLLQGRLDQAEQAYKAAIRHRPDWVEPRLSLGQYYLRQQAYDPAIAAFKAVERLDATNAKAHYALGKAYEQTGQMDAALRAYRLAVAHGWGDARQLAAIEARLAQLVP